MGIMSLAFSTVAVACKGAYDRFRAELMPFVAEEPLEKKPQPMCATQRQRLLAARADSFARLEDVDVYAFYTDDLGREDENGRSLRLLECGSLELSQKAAKGKPLVFERLDDDHFYARSGFGTGMVLKRID